MYVNCFYTTSICIFRNDLAQRQFVFGCAIANVSHTHVTRNENIRTALKRPHHSICSIYTEKSSHFQSALMASLS